MVPDLTDPNLIRTALMAVAVTIAVASDLRRRRIPNALTLPLALIGLTLGGLTGGLGGFVVSVAGCVAGGLLFLLPAAKFGWGIGDLKLVAALGAVGGPAFVLWLGLYALAAGGPFALIWLKRQGQLARVVGDMRDDLRSGQVSIARSGLAIPYAVPIAVGLVVAVLISPGLPR